MERAQIGHNSGAKPGNWIAVSRDMRDHPIVGMGKPVNPADPRRGSYSKYEAWQDLIMEAQFRPFEVMNKGKVVTLQRGQLMAARAWLAKRWNWSEKTVRVFISRLESEFMVRSETVQQRGQYKGQQRTNTVNVLNISNYDIYQTVFELMNMEKGQQKGQSEGQPRASQGPEYNKETRKQDRSPNGDMSPDELSLDEDDCVSKHPSVVRQAFDLYNETAKRCGLSVARTLPAARAQLLRQRVKDAGGMDGFRQAMANLEQSDFLQGRNDRGWKADLKFVCQASSFLRLFEGGYANKTPAKREFETVGANGVIRGRA